MDHLWYGIPTYVMEAKLWVGIWETQLSCYLGTTTLLGHWVLAYRHLGDNQRTIWQTTQGWRAYHEYLHGKFACICVKVKLSEPLIIGFWVDDGENQVMVVVLYEILPSLCYRCRWVRNVLNNCTFDSGNQANGEPVIAQTSVVRQPKWQVM